MTASREQPAASRRGFFWVGIERVARPHGTVPRGQMYVEWEFPSEPRHPYPVVMVHGGGGQGTDWLGTPDGRPGWARLFVEEGYRVYVVDRPGHGRSPLDPELLGAISPSFSYEMAVAVFTRGGEVPLRNPFAHLNTQWPGSGRIGDPALDQLVASQGPMLSDVAEAQRLEQRAGAELLDRIGPAILMTHSAGAPFGWVVGDARPQLVRAIVAIEPLGPPFLQIPRMRLALPWGLTSIPLTFDPPCDALSQLATTTRAPLEAGGPPAILQEEPARRLAHLAGRPIAIVTAEASAARLNDPLTVAFLRQAGCEAEQIRLADHGVHGNGHLMMGEKNNAEVARVLFEWLAAHVSRASA